MMRLPLAALACYTLVSCADYQLGGIKPRSLANVRKIAVPMFENGTLHPRAESIATSAVADALIEDGTYKLASFEQADAVLEGKLRSIEYSTIRGRRLDTLYPEELRNSVTLDWKLLDARDRTKLLASGSAKGTSQLFVSSNLQTARNNALPEALEKAGEAIVSRIASGY